MILPSRERELTERLRRIQRREKWNTAKQMKLLYVLVILPVVTVFVFHYLAIYGVIIAFKDYSFRYGFWRSPWNNFDHFRQLFSSFTFWRVLRNTVVISMLRLLVVSPTPIIFALLLNELTSLQYKRVVQTISYLPHFMSWVVLAAILQEVLSPQRGVVNHIITAFGGRPINFFISKALFTPMLIVTDIWKTVGWSSIIYLASLSSVDPGLYDSADVDGANRFQKAIHISIPCMIPFITILLILRMGRILNAGFDQIFNLYNPLVYEVADIIDTYVFRVGMLDQRYDYSTAVGLFKNLVGVGLLLGSNAIIKRYSEYGIW